MTLSILDSGFIVSTYKSYIRVYCPLKHPSTKIWLILMEIFIKFKDIMLTPSTLGFRCLESFFNHMIFLFTDLENLRLGNFKPILIKTYVKWCWHYHQVPRISLKSSYSNSRVICIFCDQNFIHDFLFTKKKKFISWQHTFHIQSDNGKRGSILNTLIFLNRIIWLTILSLVLLLFE